MDLYYSYLWRKVIVLFGVNYYFHVFEQKVSFMRFLPIFLFILTSLKAVIY